MYKTVYPSRTSLVLQICQDFKCPVPGYNRPFENWTSPRFQFQLYLAKVVMAQNFGIKLVFFWPLRDFSKGNCGT
jgi:hypothetical protein